MVDTTTQEKMEEAIIQKVRGVVVHGFGKVTVCVKDHGITAVEEFKTYKPEEVVEE
jgi:hypothetical protein